MRLYHVFNSDGPCLRKVIEQDVFEGVKLTNLNISQFKAARKQLVKNLVDALMKRFSEFSSSSESVVHATRIADLQTWPENWDDLEGSIDFFVVEFIVSVLVCLHVVLFKITLVCQFFTVGLFFAIH